MIEGKKQVKWQQCLRYIFSLKLDFYFFFKFRIISHV